MADVCKLCKLDGGRHSVTCGDHICWTHGSYYLGCGNTGPCPKCVAAVREREDFATMVATKVVAMLKESTPHG